METAEEFTSNWIKEHGLPIHTSTTLLEKTIAKIVDEYHKQQVKSVDLADVVKSLPSENKPRSMSKCMMCGKYNGCQCHGKR